ncbi:ABC transporter ATP-binding protein [Zobellella iuensis]|uniref:ABC transporter ATP-binding protein n=1 Tax=Zobellella iuensis TaxID=2803811 RepID=A0ABS1QLV4_9GAMM|nr:ABC transporter ATP-binding protein [Zobellella iuensis]MBL1375850.1 ABC transporter ATP-binding protein [Zobellella iuensis]
MSELLSFKGVNAGYGAAHVLHDMNLSVRQGEKVALIGRNGVGKTTVVNTLLGLASLRSGDIRLGQRQPRRLRPYMAANNGIMVVPQGRRIVPNLTVEENLMLGAAVGRAGPWRLDSLYRLFPILRERAHTPGTAMSGGQQQMLAIGRAMMANPELIVLDEPTEGLAPVIVDQLAEILNQLAEQGTSLLLIEQNLSLVGRVAERYYALSKGSVVAEGKVRQDHIMELQQHVVV